MREDVEFQASFELHGEILFHKQELRGRRGECVLKPFVWLQSWPVIAIYGKGNENPL